MYTLTLILGMLSKSRGHILRVAAVMHVLENPHSIPSTISVAAIKAADSLVGVCVQHAAYIWVDEVKWQKRLNPSCKYNKVHEPSVLM